MIKRLLVICIVAFFSTVTAAQEEAIEVGKHANVNLDSMSMILSLLMVLALIIVSSLVLKKFNVINKSAAGMKVITSLPLGHKEKLVVVEVGEEQLLLGVSQQQVSLLKVLDKPLDIGGNLSPELGQKFSQFFAKSINNK